MRELKRPAAVLGFSLLLSLILLMTAGIKAAYFVVPVLIAASVVLLVRRSKRAYYLTAVTVCFIAAILLLTGGARLKYEPSLRFIGTAQKISGTVKDFPQAHAASHSVILKHCVIDGEQTRYSVRVYYTDGSFPHPGDEVTLTASEIFSSADDTSRFFYHTLSGGTWLSAFCRGGLSVNSCDKRSPAALLAELRYRIRNKSAAYMPADLAAVSSAIVTGDQSEIPDEIRDSFRKSGVSHLFAVSGMHLTIWTGLLFAILQKRSRNRLLPNLLVLLFIWGYAAFTGFSPSVIRAGIMLSLICIGFVLRKHADPLNALGVSALLLLLWNPWLAGNISFLLSFTATFAIVGIFPLLRDRPSYTKSVFKNEFLSVREGLLLSALVLFSTIPFTAWFFGYAAVLTPITSLICTPIAELMMIFSALGAALPARLFLTRAVYTVSAALTNAIVRITEKAAAMEFAIFPLRESYILIWFLLCAAAIVMIRFRLKKSRTFLFNTLMALWSAALLTGILFTGFTAKNYEVYIPEAGNAAMISLVSGTGRRSLLLGCGGDYDAFREMKSYLQSKTAFTPDYVFIPRKGKAQTEQLTNVLQQLPPDNLLITPSADPVRGEPENAVLCDAFDGELWKNVRLRYENRPDFCAGRMEINGTAIVFCLYPASDFTDADEAYLSADHLICRGAIPDTLDPSRFSTVIVLSDKSAQTLHLPPNAVSTADTGDITLTLRRHHSTKGGS